MHNPCIWLQCKSSMPGDMDIAIKLAIGMECIAI